MASDLRIRYALLGPLEVRGPGQSLPVPSPKAGALLTALLLNVNRTVTADRLVDLLWEDDAPATAAKAVQVYVSQLRKLLRTAACDEALRTRSGGYVLQADRDEIDVFRFERLVRESLDLPLPAHAAVVSARLGTALSLWRGEALEGLRDSAFGRPEAARLDELRLEAIERRLDAELSLARHSSAIEELNRLVDRYPLRERFWALLMVAQYRCGRQAEALETYRRCRSILVEELGLEPGEELRRLHRAVLAGEPSVTVDSPSARVPRHNLPTYEDGFIGREYPMSGVARSLARSRLVSITGPGGVGKTRLAVELSRQLLLDYPDGVWLVDLAQISDPDLVAEAVAEAIGLAHRGVDPMQDVAVHLRGRSSLVVLDNCEHLVGACRDLATRLLKEDGVKLLCTSRQRLGVPEEDVWELAPLLAPESDVTQSLERLRDYPSVRLFLERARAATGRFELSSSHAPWLARICAQLDGIPLALELAAARCDVATLEEISEGIDAGLDLASPAGPDRDRRQGTLHVAVEWSLALLEPPARVLFRRIGVFPASSSPEAVGDICGHDLAGVDTLLNALVSNGLLTAERTRSGRRVRLLETMRRLASEEAAKAGEMEGLSLRHAAYFRSWAQRAGAELQGRGQLEWLDLVAQEGPNLRTAFSTLIERGEIGAAVEFVEHLWWAWYRRPAEGLWWLQQMRLAPIADVNDRAVVDSVESVLRFITGDYDAALRFALRAMESSSDAHTSSTLRALTTVGSVRLANEDLDEAETQFRRVLNAGTAVNSSWWQARGWHGIGAVALIRKDFDLAGEAVKSAMTLFRELGDRVSEVDMASTLGTVQLLKGDFADARTTLEAAIELGRSIRYRGGALFDLAMVLTCTGEPDRAVALARSGLAELWEQGHTELIPSGMEVLAAALHSVGESREGAMFFGAAARMRIARGTPRVLYAAEFCDEHLEGIRVALGAGFQAPWDEGMAMSDEADWRRLVGAV